MKITDQVANRELSQKLVDLGIVIDSYFYWHKLKDSTKWELSGGLIRELLIHLDILPAPTASELFDRLPHKIKDHYYLEIYKKQPYVAVTYRKYQVDEAIGDIQGPANNLAVALARMLIYLAEMGLLRVKKKGEKE
jgi:hypothetical protein